MQNVTRLLLAGALAASVAVTAAPATANDCSHPKNPCGGCHVNRDFLRDFALNDPEVDRLVVCYA